MEDSRARIHINIITGEFEIEGSESFIREYDELLSDVIDRMRAGASANPLQEQEPPVGMSPAPDAAPESMPDSFGEYYQGFTKALKDVDKALVAAHFAQVGSSDKTFSTKEVNNLLKEQGVSLANASRCVKLNQEKKYLFVVRTGRFRVSEDGHNYLETKRRK